MEVYDLLKNKELMLQEVSKRYQKLKEDFEYNLNLLEHKDTELRSIRTKYNEFVNSIQSNTELILNSISKKENMILSLKNEFDNRSNDFQINSKNYLAIIYKLSQLLIRERDLRRCLEIEKNSLDLKFRRLIESQCSEVAKIKSQFEETINKYKYEAESNIRDLKKTLDDTLLEKYEKENLIAKCFQDIDDLKCKLKVSQSNVDSSNEKVAILQSKIDIAIEEHACFSKKKDIEALSLKKELEGVLMENNILASELESLRSLKHKVIELQNQASNDENVIKSMRQQYDANEKNFHHKILELQLSSDELDSKLKYQVNEYVRILELLKIYQEESVNLIESKNSLESEYQKLTIETGSLNENIKELNIILGKKNQLIDNISLDMNNVVAKYSNDIRDLSSENSKLKAELSHCQENMSKMSNKVSEESSELAAMHIRYKLLENKLNEMQTNALKLSLSPSNSADIENISSFLSPSAFSPSVNFKDKATVDNTNSDSIQIASNQREISLVNEIIRLRQECDRLMDSNNQVHVVLNRIRTVATNLKYKDIIIHFENLSGEKVNKSASSINARLEDDSVGEDNDAQKLVNPIKITPPITVQSLPNKDPLKIMKQTIEFRSSKPRLKRGSIVEVKRFPVGREDE